MGFFIIYIYIYIYIVNEFQRLQVDSHLTYTYIFENNT